MQNKTMTKLKEERLEILLKDCRSTIINQMLSSFGLNSGMFTDQNGGNVTTLHNFEREDDTYIVDKDKASYRQANKKYDRRDYTLSRQEWKKKREKHLKDGRDGYTGKSEDPNKMDIDHVSPLNENALNKRNHLAYETGTDEGKEELKQNLNSDVNLTSTNKSINNAKGAKSNKKYLEGPQKKENESNEQFLKRQKAHEQKLKDNNVNRELMLEKQKQAEKKLNKDANVKLIKKQTTEVFTSGAKQAGAMALKESMGMLLTELVNIIFNEMQIMSKKGLKFNAENIKQLKERVTLRLKDLLNKIPDILKNAFDGGVSGFVSNLLTFLVNNLISTAKRFVTIIREGLLGIYKAIKMVMFPPENISTEENWRSAIKLLSTTVISAVILSFQDVITGFISTIPILIPIAEILSTVLVGVFSGITSAFVAYTIDSVIDKFCDRRDEQMLDLLMNDAKKRVAISKTLEEQLTISLENKKLNELAIDNNEEIKAQKRYISQSLKKVTNNNKAVYENNLQIEQESLVSKQNIDDISTKINATVSKLNDLSSSVETSVIHAEKMVIQNEYMINKMKHDEEKNKDLIEKTKEYILRDEVMLNDLNTFLEDHAG